MCATELTAQIAVNGKLWPADDWERELTENEFWGRFARVHGEVPCQHCGRLFRQHPLETREVAVGVDGPSLVRLCCGIFGHL